VLQPAIHNRESKGITPWNILLKGKVIHPAQGVIKMMKHPTSDTKRKKAPNQWMSPPKNKNKIT